MDPEKLRPASVLVVDDDHLTLSSLSALFRLETDHVVQCFDDPQNAVGELARNPVDVIISDYLMPKINGIELLKEAKRLQPQAARILLTGFADKENAIRAINEVGLYQYVEKPWDNEELILAVRNAYEERRLRRQLSERVRELDDLLWEHKQLSTRHSYLVSEMEMAGRVQQSLLPSRPPDIDGFRISSLYRPCLSLGGDFFDFVAHDGRVSILVADVSGHGAQAALTSMLLKASFQDAVKSEEPFQLLGHMNSQLCRFLPTGMFVAATLLTLWAKRPSIGLASAGLPYPFVIRRSARRLDQIPLQGLPLGLFEHVEPECYDVREVEMSAGDVLLVASDGLGEISNSQGQLFQDVQLRPALTEFQDSEGGDMLQTLVDKAVDFGGNQPVPDDITLLTVTKT